MPTVFDNVRASNILPQGRARAPVNYRVPTRKDVSTSRRTHGVFLTAGEKDDASSEGESNDEIEDPEPDFTPSTWKQAMSCKNALHWIRAAEEEIKGMQLSSSYELVPRPMGPSANVIDSKWVWKKKLDRWGRVKRFRARLVARGFKQVAGVDYFDTFAPVMRYKSLLILLTLAAERDFEVRHLDVPKAFLQATLNEAIFMEQPEGFHNGDKNLVWRLVKSVYGIKQAPNNWNEELNQFLLSIGLARLKTDSCIYVKQCKSGRMLALGVFVDDIIPIFSAADHDEWKTIFDALRIKFNINDTGDADLVLGIRVTRDRATRTIKMDHAPYIEKILKEFSMTDCNPAPTPSNGYVLSKSDCSEDPNSSDRALYQRMVGSLNYAAISVRPDIAFAVNILARYMQNPGPAHMTACKRVFRYLKGTPEIGLVLGQHNQPESLSIVVWSDADYSNNLDDRRSISGYIVQVNGSVISWTSKRQSTNTTSTCEAEYYALSTAVSEVKWVRMFLRELLSFDSTETPPLSFTATGKVDNTAAIAVSKNDIHHGRTKHIDIRHHHVREAIEKNQLHLEHVPTQDQLADILTKGLGRIAFERIRSIIMQ